MIDIKFYAYLVFITLASSIISNLDGLITLTISSNFWKLFFISFTIYFFIYYFYSNLYKFILKLKSQKITKGLLISSLFMVVPLLVLFIFSYYYSNFSSYDVITMEDNLLNIVWISVTLIYIVSMGSCFVTDSFFNRNIKNVPKSRVLLASLLFYILLSFIIFFITILIAIISVGVYWN